VVAPKNQLNFRKISNCMRRHLNHKILALRIPIKEIGKATHTELVSKYQVKKGVPKMKNIYGRCINKSYIISMTKYKKILLSAYIFK
jgi:hypothetical protein